MLLISWNVAGRVKALDEQVKRGLTLDADLVCLQEITVTTAPVWQARLQQAGYAGVQHAPAPASRPRRRPLMVLTACRDTFSPLQIAGVPWPERVLAVRLPGGEELVNVHSPISPAPGLAKVRTHRRASRTSRRPTRRSSIPSSLPARRRPSTTRSPCTRI